MDISKLFYHTTLKSLKNTLHKFDKQELMNDISLARDFYDEALETLDFPYDYRIKSMESCHIKYDRYYPNFSVERTFNDIFGARIIIERYQMAYSIADEKPTDVRIKIEQVKVRISHSPNRGIIETGGISPWQTILTSNLSWMQSSTTRNMRSLG